MMVLCSECCGELTTMVQEAKGIKVEFGEVSSRVIANRYSEIGSGLHVRRRIRRKCPIPF